MKRVLSLFLAVVVFATSVSISNFAIGTDEVVASGGQGTQNSEISLKEYVDSAKNHWGNTRFDYANAEKDSSTGGITLGTSGTLAKNDKFRIHRVNAGGYVTVDMTLGWDKANASGIPLINFQGQSTDGNSSVTATHEGTQAFIEIAKDNSGKKTIKIAGSNTLVSDMSQVDTARITICFDFYTGTYDVYYNGTLIKEDCATRLYSDLTGEMYFYAFEWNARGAGTTNFRIDKLQIYEGTKPRDLSAPGTPGEIVLGDTQVASGLPTMTLNTGLPSLFTIPEKEQVLVDGKDATFYLDVTQNSEDLSQVENLQACDGVGSQFNVVLYKKFGTNPAAPAEGYEVNISVAVPEELKPATPDTKRIYKIFKLDDSTSPVTATQVVSRYEETLTFDAESGAAYVLAYVDAVDNGICMKEYYSAAEASKQDSEKAGMSFTTFDNTVVYSAADNEFTFKKLNDDNCYIQKGNLGHGEDKFIIFQAKIAWTDQVPAGTVRLRGDAWYNLLDFSSGNGLRVGVWNGSKVVQQSLINAANFQENTYYDVAVAMNWETNTADVYVDGVLKLENMALQPGYTFTSTRIYINSKADGSAVGSSIKFKMYVYTREQHRLVKIVMWSRQEK